MVTQDLLNKLYGVNTLELDDPLGVNSVTQSETRILDNNPGALQITIINTGASDMLIWTDPTVSATKGILLAANGGAYEIDFTRFGSMPTREWWAVGKTGSTTVTTKRVTIV